MGELIQSTPFMPPTADTMESCRIFLFGDQTISFEGSLHQLFHVKDNDTLRSFLDKVGFALRKEFGNLPAGLQEWFPHFTTLIDLVSRLGETEGTPALKFALLCLCEIGQFIGYEAGKTTACSFNVGLIRATQILWRRIKAVPKRR